MGKLPFRCPPVRFGKNQLLPRTPPIPLRDDEVVALGKATRLKYAELPIEEVAEAESISLAITSFQELRRGGLAVRQPVETSYLFESSVEPGRLIEARYPVAHSTIKMIAVAEDYRRDDESISMEEIFWHEYFHLNWSAELPPYDPTVHEWSTHGVLDHQDERRADLFALAGLLDDDVVSSRVSKRLRKLAIEVESKRRLLSRSWEPIYANE